MNDKRIILSTMNHTWFFDIDGTICKHNGYKIDGYDSLLDGVRNFFNQIPDGDAIIFVTSRDKRYKVLTERFLAESGLRYDYVIYGLPYGERIVVNDNKPNGLNMSKAICIERNGELPSLIYLDKNL